VIRLLLFALFLSVAVPCVVPALDVASMSPQQRLELQAQLDHANKPIEVRVREEAAQWADLGANVGRALIGAAKELGIAANEFSQTGLGKCVVALVVVKLLGGTLAHLAAAVLVMLLGSTFFWYVHRRILLLPKYNTVPVLWGLWHRRVVVSYGENDSPNRDSWNVTSVLVLVVSTVVAAALTATAF
jgi:hypothetical protein